MPSKLTMKFHLDLSSEKAVQAALKGVIEGVRNRVLKQSIAKLARAGAKVAKARAPVGVTRKLRDSIGTRYRSYQRGLVWAYVIGPRKGVWGMRPSVPQKNGTMGIKEYIPTKIAHLAERGRGPLTANKAKVMAFYSLKKRRANAKTMTRRKISHAVFAKRVGPAAGQPFMAPAYDYIDSPSMRRRVIRDIELGIYREAVKYANKGKSIYR